MWVNLCGLKFGVSHKQKVWGAIHLLPIFISLTLSHYLALDRVSFGFVLRDFFALGLFACAFFAAAFFIVAFFLARFLTPALGLAFDFDGYSTLKMPMAPGPCELSHVNTWSRNI